MVFESVAMSLRHSHLILALLLALPVAVVTLYLFRPDKAVPDDCRMVPIERWRNGEPKTLTCDWVKNNIEYARYCAIKPDGKEAGCWVTRNGEPYEGDVVEWYVYGRMPDPQAAYGVARAIMRFSRGQPDGVWLNYYPNGKLMNETVFENGRSKEVRLYDQSGKLVRKNSFSYP